MIVAFPPLETTSLIDDLIARNAPIAIGVSGGKDSTVAAFEILAYLKRCGYQGEVLLIHSDLGRVEHKDSLPACQRLADRLDLELVVVRREKGDMMDRWIQRYHDNVKRYQDLLCVKLICHYSHGFADWWNQCFAEGHCELSVMYEIFQSISLASR